MQSNMENIPKDRLAKKYGVDQNLYSYSQIKNGAKQLLALAELKHSPFDTSDNKQN